MPLPFTWNIYIAINSVTVHGNYNGNALKYTFRKENIGDLTVYEILLKDAALANHVGTTIIITKEKGVIKIIKDKAYNVALKIALLDIIADIENGIDCKQL